MVSAGWSAETSTNHLQSPYYRRACIGSIREAMRLARLPAHPVPSLPLDIALVILHADPARGGAERYTVDLAHALAGQRHATSLLASSFAGVDPSVRQVLIGDRGTTRLGRYLHFLADLETHLDHTRYDIVHAM